MAIFGFSAFPFSFPHDKCSKKISEISIILSPGYEKKDICLVSDERRRRLTPLLCHRRERRRQDMTMCWDDEDEGWDECWGVVGYETEEGREYSEEKNKWQTE
jgi:hypothetical protein